jgi:hypothetical protein
MNEIIQFGFLQLASSLEICREFISLSRRISLTIPQSVYVSFFWQTLGLFQLLLYNRKCCNEQEVLEVCPKVKYGSLDTCSFTPPPNQVLEFELRPSHLLGRQIPLEPLHQPKSSTFFSAAKLHSRVGYPFPPPASRVWELSKLHRPAVPLLCFGASLIGVKWHLNFDLPDLW